MTPLGIVGLLIHVGLFMLVASIIVAFVAHRARLGDQDEHGFRDGER